MDKFICPVCGFDNLEEPPRLPKGGGSYEICPCCGFEYGFDDDSKGWTYETYREKWIKDGSMWFDPEEKPKNWSLDNQLKNLEKI